MSLPKRTEPIGHARLERLARNIEKLAEKDERRIQHALEMEALRRDAARELHAVCAGFVSSVNQLLAHPVVDLDPPEFGPAGFREDAPNLIQINIRGRVLQVKYHAAPELLSTEEFRIAYTLEGSVTAFNQDLVDKSLIEEKLLFYTVEPQRKMWRYFDARTYRSGAFDQGYLITLMESVV